VTKTSTSNGITVSVTTSGGSVDAVTLNASAFTNVMHFRDVVTTLPSTNNVKGDIVVVGVNPTSPLVQGQEYIWTSTTSTGTNHWELIGDQNTYATKAYVDTQLSSVAQLAADGYSLALSADATATAAYASAITNAATAGDSITTTNGNLVTASAVASYAMKKGDVAGGSYTSTSNNISVRVDIAATTAEPTVYLAGVGTAAARNFVNVLGSSGTNLPTESAVYSAISAMALVWLDASGQPIS